MLVALASATAIAILLPAGAPGIDDGCPSPRQVGDAVAAHLPGLVQPLGRPPGPGALRLLVTTDASGTLRVDLSDPEGGALLRRRVAPEAGTRAKPGDCLALAETAALIVDRYWHEVGYEVPPQPAKPQGVTAPKPPPAPTPPPPKPAQPPPPAEPPTPPVPTDVTPAVPPRSEPAEPAEPAEPPRAPEPSEPPPPKPAVPLHPPDWWLAARAAAEVGDRGPWHIAVSLAFAVERPAFGQRLGLRFSVTGLDPEEHPSASKTAPTVSATMTQFRVGMDAYLAFPVGLGRIEPGIGVELGVVIIRSTEGNRSESPVIPAPAVDATLAWTVPISRDFFVRALAVGAAAPPTRLVAGGSDGTEIFNTPRLRAQLGLECGLWFY